MVGSIDPDGELATDEVHSGSFAQLVLELGSSTEQQCIRVPVDVVQWSTGPDFGKLTRSRTRTLAPVR
jgi:hypothetical protein